MTENLGAFGGREYRFRLFPGRRRHVASGFLWTLLAALFLTTAASAQDQGESADNEGWPQSWSLPASPSTSRAPRWTVSIEAVALGRSGGVDQALVSRAPGATPFYVSPPGVSTANAAGVEAFDSNQFQQGLSAAPKVSLIYRGDSGYGAELTYFGVLGLSDAKAIGPDGDWLVMRAPGSFWQTPDFSNQAMAWKSTTKLYGAEANGRLDLSSRATILAGFRWLRLDDNLQGALTPPDTAAPTWKTGYPCSPSCTFAEIPAMPNGGQSQNYPPFWTTSTTNNLYGAQIGADVKMLELGRFSLDGLIKTGIFDNDARQSTVVSMAKALYPSQAATNRAAFVGEAALQLKYQFTEGLALKAGYEALWLDGVALAPGQIQETHTTPTTVTALGVNCGSGALFQGVTAGLEFSF
jgi:hypothetical protein